jgi:hypothetical protein
MSDSAVDGGRTEAGLPRAKVILADAVAHAAPLILFYRAQGSVQGYLLLTAFDLALGLILIVGTTRDPKDPTTVDPRAAWLSARIAAALIQGVFLGVVAAFLLIPLAMPAFIFGMEAHVDWVALVTRPGFYLTVAFMMLSAGVRAQLRFEATTRVGERGTSLHAGPVVGDLARDRRNAQAAYAAQVTLIGVYLLLCFLLIHFGRNGLYIFPALYASLLIFFDARPDIGQRIFADLWPKPGEQSKRPKRGRRR